MRAAQASLTDLLSKRRPAAHGFRVQVASCCHNGLKCDLGPQLLGQGRSRHLPPAHRASPGAVGLPGAVHRQAHPRSAEDGPGLRGLPSRLATLSQAHGVEEAVPTCGAVGEARPTRVPVSPCPHATNTHGLSSLSRVSREPVLAWGALKKEAKGRSFIQF